MSEPTTAAGRALLTYELTAGIRAEDAMNAMLGRHWEMREAILAIEQEARAAYREVLVRRIEQADHDWLCAEESISDPDQWTDDELAAHEATLAAVLDLIRGDSPK